MRLALILLAATAFGQIPNTVTASASVTQPVSAGTATFSIQFVDISTASTVDSAAGVLASTGVSAANVTGVSVSIDQGFILTQYDFTLRVPAGEFAGTRDKLVAVQRSLATSSTQGLGWSTAYEASADDKTLVFEAALPGLLEKARARAEILARGMNATLGSIVSLSAPDTIVNGLNTTVSISATYSVTPVQ